MESNKATDQDRITQREAAAIIGRHARYLQRRDKDGSGPASIRKGNKRIYSRAGVLAWARAEGLLS